MLKEVLQAEGKWEVETPRDEAWRCVGNSTGASPPRPSTSLIDKSMNGRIFILFKT